MKAFLSILLICIGVLSIHAQQLGIIETNSNSDIHDLFDQENISVHFYNDDFAIITGDYNDSLQYSVIEKEGFNKEYNYFVYFINEDELTKLKDSIAGIGGILFSNQSISIIKVLKSLNSKFIPIRNDALIYFDESKAFISDYSKSKLNSEVFSNQDIYSMVMDVNADSIEATIEYLSSFKTRDCYSAEVVEALTWIGNKFKSYGLSVSYQDLTAAYGIPSFNVIATQIGTRSGIKEGDASEYVVVGGHADSRSSGATAPGADDNASGVAGVLEIARILSQNSYDRTIIYCAFSGEEYGLFGSKYFATDFRNRDKNILAYVNLDMIGYKYSNQSYFTSLIYPSTAQELANYYKTICSIYTPNLGVIDGMLSGGNSDHASFNAQGYMGIFPFEDVHNYSPYIHTSSDILGLSVNNMEQAKKFTRAALATVASLAEKSYNLSSEKNLRESHFSIYPNPATNNLTISFEGQQSARIEVYNILGEIILNKTIENLENIDISALVPGQYFVKLNSKEYFTVKKFIIK